MSPRHFTLYSLLVFLLLFASGGAYLYLQLPALIASHGPSYLADYGVDSITSTRPKLTPRLMHLAGLSLRGGTEDYRFSAVLEGVEVSYSANSLAQGELEGIFIERLTLTLEQLPSQGQQQSASVITLSEVLPPSMTELLPARSLSIGEIGVQLDTQNQASLTASGSLSIREGLQAKLASEWQGMQILLGLNTDHSPTNTDIDLQLLQDDNKTLSLRASSSVTATGQWQWQIGADIEPGSLLDWLSRPEVSTALPASFDTLQSVSVGGNITLAGSLHHKDRLDTATFADSIDAELDISSADTTVSLPDGAGSFLAATSAHLSIGPGQLQMSIPELEISGSMATGLLGLPADTLQTLGWGDNIPVAWRQQEPLLLTLMPGGDIKATVTASTLKAGAADTALALDLQDTAVHLAGNASEMPQLESAFELGGTFANRALPPLSGTVSLGTDEGDAQTLSVQVTEPSGTLALQLTGSGQPLQGAGSYRLVAVIKELAAAKSAYSPLVPSDLLPQPLPELRAGSAALVSDITARGWDNPATWQWRSGLNIDSLALTYDTYTLDGLSLELQWLGLEQWQTTAPATLEVAQINVGFALRDLSLVVSLPDPTPPLAPDVRLQTLEVALLGGRAYLPRPQTWDFASANNNLLLEVENLALAQIVALQQSDQISAEGRLSGRLPLTLMGERIIIDSGHLGAAAPGGIIRYQPDEAGAALAGNSPELGMALELLRNFHYDLLSSEVALDESGNLLLGLSLAGRNPDYEQGQAVNFNINLEQNIGPLLQSLRLSGSVLEQLEKKQR